MISNWSSGADVMLLDCFRRLQSGTFTSPDLCRFILGLSKQLFDVMVVLSVLYWSSFVIELNPQFPHSEDLTLSLLWFEALLAQQSCSNLHTSLFLDGAYDSIPFIMLNFRIVWCHRITRSLWFDTIQLHDVMVVLYVLYWSSFLIKLNAAFGCLDLKKIWSHVCFDSKLVWLPQQSCLLLHTSPYFKGAYASLSFP